MEFHQPVAQLTRTELSISKSKFITSITKCETVSDAKTFVGKIKVEFSSASHHIYAFIVGHGDSIIEGKSDDGEPSGTAGHPTLTVLRGSKLGNICAVTARYFGGTKLGTGGLVKAYTESVQLCHSSLKTEKNVRLDHFTMLVPYRHYSPVNSILLSSEVSNMETQFNDKISISFDVVSEAAFSLNAKIRDATAGIVVLFN